MEQNYPNPFNSATQIKFYIGSAGSSIISVDGEEDIVSVTLKIFDIIGNEVEVLFNKAVLPGEYKVIFEASNLPSGVYFYQLQTYSNGQNRRNYITKKMILLK